MPSLSMHPRESTGYLAVSFIMTLTYTSGDIQATSQYPSGSQRNEDSSMNNWTSIRQLLNKTLAQNESRCLDDATDREVVLESLVQALHKHEEEQKTLELQMQNLREWQPWGY